MLGFLIWELIFFYLLRTFCPHLGSFCVVSSSLRFGQISPLAFFRWLTATSDRNAESCLNVWNCASAWEWKLPNWERERKRKKAFEVANYVSNHDTWPANARSIFARDKIKMHRRSWKHMACNYSVQSGSRNYSIYWRLTTFVSGRSVSWILFLEFFLLHMVIVGHSKNIGV